jgi:hypothetical protein
VQPAVATGRIVGAIVAAAGGVPIAGATIRLREEGSGVASDRAGRFELTALPPGTYVVESTASGYPPAEATVAVSPGAVAEAAIGWVDPENGLEPDLNDLLAKVSCSPSERTLLSGSILTARGRTHYLEVMNLLNRENLARPESYSFVLNPDGTLDTVTEYEGALPIIPALGVRWTF